MATVDPRARPDPDPDADPGAPIRPDRRTGPGALALLLAASLAGVALAGCSSDGGISGTGGLPADVATAPAEGDGGAPDAVLEVGDQGFAGPEPEPFENTIDALGGITAGLRGANLSARAVRVEVGGGPVGQALAAGEIGPVLPLDNQTTDVAVVDAATGTALARLDATLVPGSLTTLLAYDGPDGAFALAPLATLTGADDASVARVRVAWAVDPAAAPARVADLELVPDGATPGAAPARFAIGPGGTIASDYESVGAGDYRLVGAARGLSAAVSLEGGTTYTLALFEPVAGALEVAVIVDGAAP